MATSLAELYTEYQRKGGTADFSDFRERYMAKVKANANPLAATEKAKKNKKLVSGKFRGKLARPLKRKYST